MQVLFARRTGLGADVGCSSVFLGPHASDATSTSRQLKPASEKRQGCDRGDLFQPPTFTAESRASASRAQQACASSRR